MVGNLVAIFDNSNTKTRDQTLDLSTLSFLLNSSAKMSIDRLNVFDSPGQRPKIGPPLRLRGFRLGSKLDQRCASFADILKKKNNVFVSHRLLDSCFWLL